MEQNLRDELLRYILLSQVVFLWITCNNLLTADILRLFYKNSLEVELKAF